MNLMVAVDKHLLQLESDARDYGIALDLDNLRAAILLLDKVAMDRTICLQRFVGMAQERTWPSLESINEARKLMGMHALDQLAGV